MTQPVQFSVDHHPGLAATQWWKSSEATPRYNCVAFAAGFRDRFISPVLYDEMLGLYPWPEGVPREYSVSGYAAAMETFGYTQCADATLEEGVEKIAIYGQDGTAEHIARQLTSGMWTSKMGQWEDIEHELEGLAGGKYGEILLLMQRPRIPAPGE